MSTEQLNCQRALFDLPEEVSYINCAYQSPKLKASVAVAEAQLRRSGQPWSISSEDFFAPAERLRSRFAELIGASPQDIAIVPSVSYGISTAAANLEVQPNEQIVVLSEQFPSNVYPWSSGQGGLRVVERPDSGSWSDRVIDAIDTQCAVVALPGVHWTDGYRLDLQSISAQCRASNAALVLDLTQSAGVIPFSVQEVDTDFIAVATYKWLLGPLGLSFLYVNPRHQGGTPIEFGWLGREGSEDFSRLVHYTDRYQPGARRFDAGQRTNNTLIEMANTALEQVLNWGPGRISQYNGQLTHLIAEMAQQRGLMVTQEDYRSPHLVGIELGDGDTGQLMQSLTSAEVFVSLRGSKLRVAPHIYNAQQDVERLFEVIDRSL